MRVQAFAQRLGVQAKVRRLAVAAYLWQREVLDRVFGDSVSLAENVSISTSFARSEADAVTVLDAASLGWAPAPADAATLTELFLLAVDRNLALADTVTASDVMNVLGTFTRSIGDAVSPTDSAPTFALSRSAAETVMPVESFVAAFDVAPLADTAGASDSFGYVASFFRLFSDVVTALDDVQAFLGQSPSFSDVQPLTEDVQLSVGLSYADVATLSDVAAVNFAQPQTDSVTAADSMPTFGIAPGPGDAATLSENYAFAIAPGYSDLVGPVDFVAFNIGPTFGDTLSTPVDVYWLDLGLGRADSVTLSEAQTKNIAPGVADSVTPAEMGSWLMQDYVDPSYLAEDYVGSSGSF